MPNVIRNIKNMSHGTAKTAYKLLPWLILVSLFVIFKQFYPYPNFLPESFDYLKAANINTYLLNLPTGYSNFLRFFSAITHSDILLVLFQYLFLQLALLKLVNTVCIELKLSNVGQLVLTVIILFNPLSLFVSNCVTPDAIFSALTIHFLIQLNLLQKKVTVRLAIWHLLTIAVAISISLHGIYYGLISILFQFVYLKPGKSKWVAVAATIVVWSGSIYPGLVNPGNKNGYNLLARSFGWTFTANALQIFNDGSHIESVPVEKRFAAFNKLILSQIDSNISQRKPSEFLSTGYYQNSSSSPQYAYMMERWKMDTSRRLESVSAEVSFLYIDYSLALVKHNKIAFLRTSTWPAFKNYMSPPIEYMGYYNKGIDSLPQYIRNWFAFGPKERVVNSKLVDTSVTSFIKGQSTIINCCFLVGLIYYLLGIGRNHARQEKSKIPSLLSIYWLSEACYATVSNTATLRNQLVPGVVGIIMVVQLISLLLKEERTRNETVKTKNILTTSPYK